MAAAAKALFLEAMRLDECNQLMPALSKYLEAIIQFGSCLLETSKIQSVDAIQSKTFGDQTKAAMQCLDRVYALYLHFQNQDSRCLSPPTVTLTPDLNATTDTGPSPSVSQAQLSPNVILRHTEGNSVAAGHNSRRASSPMASAMENNQRLIAQFRDVIRQKQAQTELSSKDVAQMETQLQKKITENLAVAEQSQRLAAIPPGNFNTMPCSFDKKGNRNGDRSSGPVARKAGKGKISSTIGQWATLGPHDTLGLGSTIGERWRSKSGDRVHFRDTRFSSESSVFDETELANALNDGDSDNEVPKPASGLIPTVEETFSAEACSEMSPEQRQQQQVFMELIYTERTHVRSMKMLQKLFYQPLSRSNILPSNFVSYLPVTFLDLIFANLDEVVDLHTNLGKTLKAIVKERRVVNEIGATLSQFFDGESVEKFKKAVAQFCQHQQFALEQLELRRQQDQAFAILLKISECHPACNGFKLRDFLPIEMQRVSKYPLLFERLLKYADPTNSEEIERLKMCHYNSQQVLSRMNACKREFENAKKLAEIQSRLDTAPFYRVQHPIVQEYSKFTVLQHGFVFEGGLRLMKMNGLAIEMLGILCDEILLLLTKRGLCADERLRLQFHDDTVLVGAGRPILLRFPPIVKLAHAKLKDAPSSANEFYILCTSGEVLLYHLIASDAESKTRWMKSIQNQIDKITKVHNAVGGDPVDKLSRETITALEATTGDVGEQLSREEEADDEDFAEFSDDDEDSNRERKPR